MDSYRGSNIPDASIVQKATTAEERLAYVMSTKGTATSIPDSGYSTVTVPLPVYDAPTLSTQQRVAATTTPVTTPTPGWPLQPLPPPRTDSVGAGATRAVPSAPIKPSDSSPSTGVIVRYALWNIFFWGGMLYVLIGLPLTLWLMPWPEKYMKHDDAADPA